MEQLSIIERDTLYFIEEMTDSDNIFYIRTGRLETLAENVGCDTVSIRRSINRLTKLGYIEKVRGGYFLCV